MGEQQLGMTTRREEDFGKWYEELVEKSGLAEHAPVAGCMVIKPYGYAIWEKIQDVFDEMIQDEAENCYFPMFITEELWEKEKDLLEGFSPELAWIEQEERNMEHRVALRPTSEAIISEYMAKWIRSHRDLPLRLNQWCNTVRWEATDTRYFLRTREFLWQEGHTAHETNEEADEEMLKRLLQYKTLYEDFLAIPALLGRKPEHDKFPGAKTTTTVEALMPSGKSVQAATSHNLGTNFSKAFNIKYEDRNGEKQYAWTASWGLSTRVIGALLMTHSDDDGLVLPPRIAPTQVVIIPIYQDDNRDEVLAYAETVQDTLHDKFRVEMDDRENKSPGFKFHAWELKGVPLRIEVGPNEVAENDVTFALRHNQEKHTYDAGSLAEKIGDTLEEIQDDLFAEADQFLQANIREASSLDGIVGMIKDKPGYVKTGWCGSQDCEQTVKDAVHAEIVMIPLEDEAAVQDTCAVCGGAAEETAYFAKNY